MNSALGLMLPPEQGRISGQVHKGAHKRGNIGTGKGALNGRVVRRDRCPGIKTIR